MPYKVTGKITKGSLFEAEVDGFKYTFDQPSEDHKPLGTSPGGALALALAGCKAMSAAAYFNARNKDVEISITLNAAYPPDGIRQKMETSVVLEFEGDDITDKDLKLVQRVVERACTVEHVVLGENNQIETEYKKK